MNEDSPLPERASGAADPPSPEAGASGRSASTPMPMGPLSTRVPGFEGYEIVRELGRGGMGVVYEARQLKLHRTVALKMVIAGEYAGERVMARFLTEAKTAASLLHSNIVQIYDVGESLGLPFFAMEFVGGGSMVTRIRKMGDDFGAIAAFFEKLARATHWAHLRSVIHRDLKPANILVGMDGEPKIADFGLAKRLDDTDGPALTRSGEQMGTPSYMAPEQAFPDLGPVGPGADIYSLGVMLYEALAGKLPITGASQAEMLTRLLNEDPSSPAWLRPGLPRELETVCMKCLRKKPKDRYLSAGDLADDLRRFCNGEPVLARPPSVLTKTFRYVRRHRIGFGVTATLTAALAGGGLWARHQYLYGWEYTAAYAQLLKEHGQPRGFGPPLTDDQIAKRGVSWQIVRKGREGRVLRLVCIDCRGQVNPRSEYGETVVPGLLRNLPSYRRPAVCEYRYNGDGVVEEERLLDASGRLVTRYRYTYPEGYDPKHPEGLSILGSFVDGDSLPMQLPDGCSGIRLIRDARGRDAQWYFVDPGGNPRPDRYGVSGVSISRNDAGQITGVTNLDESGQPRRSSQGWVRSESILDERGRVTEIALFDADSKPALCNGVHLYQREFDDWDNLLRVRTFAADRISPTGDSEMGNPPEVIATYDKGRIIRSVGTGYNESISKYYSIDIRTEWPGDNGACRMATAWKDRSGNLVQGWGGYSTAVVEQNALGRTVREIREGYDPSKTGYFRWNEESEYSAAGDKIRSVVTWQNERGEAVRNLENNARQAVWDFDQWARASKVTLTGMGEKAHCATIIVENQFPDMTGRGSTPFPALAVPDNGDATAAQLDRKTADATRRLANLRDTDQRPIRKIARYLDEKGEPAPRPEGNTGWIREYNTSGQDVREIHTGFDPEKYPWATIDIRTARREDNTGSTVTWTFLDKDGKSVRNKDGYLTYVEDRNKDDRPLSIVTRGYDPKIAGFAAEIDERTYDSTGLILSRVRRYEDADGKPVRGTEGFARREESYAPPEQRLPKPRHAREAPVRIVKSGFDSDAAGYETEIEEREYNEQGRTVRLSWHYQHADGSPARYLPDGYTDYVTESDERGDEFRTTTSGFDPDLVPYHGLIRTVIERDRAASLIKYRAEYFNAAGQPIPGTRGQAVESRTFINDSLTQNELSGFDEAHHGFSSSLMTCGSGGEVLSAEYRDSKGNLVEDIRTEVRFVEKGSRAAAFGLQAGDVLLSCGGVPVGNSFLWTRRKGMEGKLEVLRGDKVITTGEIGRGQLGIYVGDRAAALLPAAARKSVPGRP